MIGIVAKNGAKGEVSMTRGFAIAHEAGEIVKFINSVSEKTNGSVARTDGNDIKEQIGIAAVVARDMSNGNILAYNGSSMLGKSSNGTPVIEIKPGVVADEFVGRTINGDSKAILADSIREKYPQAVLISVKSEAELRKGKAESLKEMGFVSDREADTVENYRNSVLMRELNVSERFWDNVSAKASGGNIWIGIQTKETYDDRDIFSANKQQAADMKEMRRDSCEFNSIHSRSCLP